MIDDSDLISCSTDNETSGEDIQETFQSELDDWALLLRLTGGELDPGKSVCYIIDFRWDGKQW